MLESVILVVRLVHCCSISLSLSLYMGFVWLVEDGGGKQGVLFVCSFFFRRGGSGGFNWVNFDDFGAKLTRRIG